MSQQLSQPITSFNNDRMASVTAFRTPSPMVTRQTPISYTDTTSISQAAPALPKTPAPRPTKLDDSQADLALEQVQDNAKDVLSVHNGIDPERVARLLSLLD